MNISPLHIDLFVLMSFVVMLVFSGWLYYRFSMQSQIENRLSGLFPKDLLIIWETLAQKYPVRYLLLMFLAMLGISTFITDISVRLNVYYPSALIRYGVAAGIAVFALISTRMNAKRRAP